MDFTRENECTHATKSTSNLLSGDLPDDSEVTPTEGAAAAAAVAADSNQMDVRNRHPQVRANPKEKERAELAIANAF